MFGFYRRVLRISLSRLFTVFRDLNLHWSEKLTYCFICSVFRFRISQPNQDTNRPRFSTISLLLSSILSRSFSRYRLSYAGNCSLHFSWSVCGAGSICSHELQSRQRRRVTEFIDGLVIPSEENLVTEGSQTGASGRTLFLGCFNLCTTDMFIQLEAPPVLAKPKLLGSVLGIEAKASLELDLQGRRLRNSGILRIWRFRWSFIARETETSDRNGEKGVEKFPPPPLLSG